MRAVVQRCRSGRVLVAGDVVGEISSPGLVVLVGATEGDDCSRARLLAEKIWRLRILSDGEGKMNRSCSETGSPLLVVSQFTLYADTSRGRRPFFGDALAAAEAAVVIEELVSSLRALGAEVETGVFGAEMLLELANDGPVTLILEV